MRLSVFAASTLILATTALGACGGVDKTAYVDSVTDVQQKTSSDASSLSEDMAKATTPAAISSKLEELGKAVAKNSVALDKIEAPSEVEALHQQYVDLMAKFGTDLEGLAADLKKADAKGTGALLTKASKLTSDLATDESKIVQDINDELR